MRGYKNKFEVDKNINKFSFTSEKISTQAENFTK